MPLRKAIKKIVDNVDVGKIALLRSSSSSSSLGKTKSSLGRTQKDTTDAAASAATAVENLLQPNTSGNDITIIITAAEKTTGELNEKVTNKNDDFEGNNNKIVDEVNNEKNNKGNHSRTESENSDESNEEKNDKMKHESGASSETTAYSEDDDGSSSEDEVCLKFQ
ncbi:hypothetical protein PoB_000144400 [Plakobranchus ocellatus]|uniref:Uncharacterized protein n=1 Tax=Plakobranchus ocellatus TaxID=259542 RepID=A0AAV3XVN5_9GAST|nr:hypothetical protein PoB_000144400 [Plakobranchus ocellatus]